MLVVDDEPFIQLALSTLLSKLGCKVDKASNGKIAIDMVQKKQNAWDQYEMIFMDVNMPVMSGYEAAQKITKNLKSVAPIICVSAQDSLMHREKCKECGMSDIISKPCTIIKLNEVLKKYNVI